MAKRKGKGRPRKEPTESTWLDHHKKMFGSNSFETLDIIPDLTEADFIRTGSIGIDYMILGGGFAKGKIAEVYGDAGTGKTTLALQTSASVIREGNKVIYYDQENGLNPNYVKSFFRGENLPLKNFAVSSTEMKEAEKVFASMADMVEDPTVGLIVVDSVASLFPEAWYTTDKIGEMGRFMSKNLVKLVAAMKGVNTKCAIMLINQKRAKLNMTYAGESSTTTGGNALKYYTSQKIELRRIGSVKSGEEIIGNRVRVKGVKQRYGKPFTQYETDFLFGIGFDQVGEVIDLAIVHNMIKKAGPWYAIGEEKIQGRDNLRKHLLSSPETLEDYKQKLKNIYSEELSL